MKTTCPVLLVLLLLAAPTTLQAQFTYTTNNGAITLSQYNGSGGAVVISNFVVTVGQGAFQNKSSLTGITIPGNVTSIGNDAFYYCTSLTNTLTNGACCFADPQWTNYPGRYYRIRSR